jgi:hypothetical protein
MSSTPTAPAITTEATPSAISASVEIKPHYKYEELVKLLGPPAKTDRESTEGGVWFRWGPFQWSADQPDYVVYQVSAVFDAKNYRGKVPYSIELYEPFPGTFNGKPLGLTEHEYGFQKKDDSLEWKTGGLRFTCWPRIEDGKVTGITTERFEQQ